MLETWSKERQKTSDFKLQLLLQGLADKKAEEELRKSREYEKDLYQTREDAALNKQKQRDAAAVITQAARDEEILKRQAQTWDQQQGVRDATTTRGIINQLVPGKQKAFAENWQNMTWQERQKEIDDGYPSWTRYQGAMGKPLGPDRGGRTIPEIADFLENYVEDELVLDEATRQAKRQNVARTITAEQANEDYATSYIRQRRALGDKRPEPALRQEALAISNRQIDMDAAKYRSEMGEIEDENREKARLNTSLASLFGITKSGMTSPGSKDAYRAAQIANVASTDILDSASFGDTSKTFSQAVKEGPTKRMLEDAAGLFPTLSGAEELFSKASLKNPEMADARNMVIDAAFSDDLGRLRVNIGANMEEVKNNYLNMANGNQMLAILSMMDAPTPVGQGIRRRILAGMISFRLLKSPAK